MAQQSILRTNCMNDFGGNQSLQSICGKNAAFRFGNFFTNVCQAIVIVFCQIPSEGKMKKMTDIERRLK
jgi:hypothetical protein